MGKYKQLALEDLENVTEDKVLTPHEQMEFITEKFDELDKSRFKPTELLNHVYGLLKKHFGAHIDKAVAIYAHGMINVYYTNLYRTNGYTRYKCKHTIELAGFKIEAGSTCWSHSYDATIKKWKMYIPTQDTGFTLSNAELNLLFDKIQ